MASNVGATSRRVLIRTICASPVDWANYEKDQKAKTQAMLDRARDQEDNRRLYPGMKSN